MAFDPNTFKSPDSQPRNASKFNPETFKSPEQAQQEQQQAKVAELASISPTRAALQGMISAAADQAVGIAQAAMRTPMARMGMSAADSSGQLPEQLQQRTQDVKGASDEAYATAKEAHPVAAMGGYAAGAIAPMAAMPTSRAASVGARIGEGATVGADIGGTQPVGPDGSPGGNMIAGGVIGGAVPAAGAAIKGAKEWVGGSANLAKGEIGKHVAHSDQAAMQDAVGASKRSGVHLTPGEATGNKVLLGEEGRIPMSPSTQYKVADTIKGRNEAVVKEAKAFTGSLIPEGKDQLSKAVNKLYDTAKPKVVPMSSMKDLSRYPAFTKAENTIQKKLGPDAPKPGTVEYLDTVKRYLDDEISTGLKSGKSSKGVELAAVKNLRQKVIGYAEDAAPEYGKARAGAQKIIIKNNLEKQLTKVSDEFGLITPGNIRKAWFKTSEKSEKFYKDLSQVTDDPKVVQRAKDLETVLNKLGNSTYDKLLNANPLELGKYEAARGPIEFGKLQAYRAIFGRRDKAVVDLISNPHWGDELTKLANSKATDKEIGKQLTGLLSRATAKGVTQPGSEDR